MKYFIIGLVFLFIVSYLWNGNRTEKFRKSLKEGMNASYYQKNKRIRGKVAKIHPDKSGNVNFVEVNNILIHRDNLYR